MLLLVPALGKAMVRSIKAEDVYDIMKAYKNNGDAEQAISNLNDLKWNATREQKQPIARLCAVRIAQIKKKANRNLLARQLNGLSLQKKITKPKQIFF